MRRSFRPSQNGAISEYSFRKDIENIQYSCWLFFFRHSLSAKGYGGLDLRRQVPQLWVYHGLPEHLEVHLTQTAATRPDTLNV